MNNKNNMMLTFSSVADNESFARMAVAAFIMPLDPTVSEINDIKTAVSEAVTNSIIHGYDNLSGEICLKCSYCDRTINIEISDQGRGIPDIKKAMTPLYTSKPELERSGLGFTVMEAFMDNIEVISSLSKGTTVKMTKKLSDMDNGGLSIGRN